MVAYFTPFLPFFQQPTPSRPLDRRAKSKAALGLGRLGWSGVVGLGVLHYLQPSVASVEYWVFPNEGKCILMGTAKAESLFRWFEERHEETLNASALVIFHLISRP